MTDLDRLRLEYAARARRLAGRDLYSPFNPAALFALQQRQRQTLRLLRQIGLRDLKGLQILEMGCGSGGVLIEYLACGARPENLHGLDLLPDRLEEARRRLPVSPLICADGQRLPYPDASFDLALQYTAFSSLLDDQVKRRIAGELLRTLRPGGWLIWYDFWLNPSNPQARGIRPAEVRRLFPGCRIIFRRTTLAPPLARPLVPRSWPLALLLESLTVFNTHYLAALQKPVPVESVDLRPGANSATHD